LNFCKSQTNIISHKYAQRGAKVPGNESSKEQHPGSVLKITDKYYLAQIRETRSDSSKEQMFQGAKVPYMELSLPGANGLGSEKSSYHISAPTLYSAVLLFS